MIFMEKIEFLRERNNLNQNDIAKLLNISSSSYSNYKRYDRILPLKHLNTIANYFNVSFDYLFDLDNIINYKILNRNLDTNTISKRLIMFRKENKISQTELAKVLNTTQSTISAYEKGETLILTSFLYTICNKYHISADYLLGKTDNPKYLNR